MLGFNVEIQEQMWIYLGCEKKVGWYMQGEDSGQQLMIFKAMLPMVI